MSAIRGASYANRAKPEPLVTPQEEISLLVFTRAVRNSELRWLSIRLVLAPAREDL